MAEAAVLMRPRPLGPGWKTSLRISNIPISITLNDFYEYLERLVIDRDGQDTVKDSDNNVLLLSLAPSPSDNDSRRFQVATVTFNHIPLTIGPNILLGPSTTTFKIDVDTHFGGLTPLNYPCNPTVDIIAVTGLAGHAFGSWRSREGPEMWLRDFLPEDLQQNDCNARILTYGYDTKLAESLSDAGIYELSKHFLEAVKSSRPQDGDRKRPIILIGHSLGGLVIKQALVEADQSLLRSCYAVLFFGVPNRGLGSDHLMSMVKGQPNERLLRDLYGPSQFLGLLHRAFCKETKLYAPNLKIICFYETKDTRTVAQSTPNKWTRSGPYIRMVSHESAIHTLADRICEEIPLDADHSTIVKFTCRLDQNYQIVRDKLLMLTKEAPQGIRALSESHKEGPTADQRNCLRSLIPNNNDPTLKIPHLKPHPGTCHWILSNDTYRGWHSREDQSKILWIAGHPGTGKTVIMSYLLSVLKKEPSNPIYFFCDDKDEEQRTATAVLKSLIYQLLHIYMPLFKYVMPYFEQFRLGEQPKWSFDMLWQIFYDFVCDKDLSSSRVYCLIDALDECAQTDEGEVSRNELLGRITELYASDAGCHVWLCISSRPYTDLRTYLRLFDTIPLDEAATKHDISLFIGEKLQGPFSALFSDDITGRVVEHLQEEAHGSFLWVALFIRDLGNCFTDADVEDLIERVPQGVFGYYEKILSRIPPSFRGRAKQIFMWITYARRPMSLDELNNALAISTAIPANGKSKNITKLTTADSFNKYKSKDLKLDLENCCGLLVDFRETSDNTYTVTFIHQSVKDFFVDTIQNSESHAQFYISPQIANEELAGYCITYLTLDDFRPIRYSQWHTPCTDRCPLEIDSGSYPLFSDYCASSWYNHLRLSRSLSLMTQDAFLKFQTSHTEHFQTCIALSIGNSSKDMLPIHAATLLNLPTLVLFLLENGADTSTRYSDGLTPLALAILFERVEVAKVLLDNGVDINEHILWGTTVLINSIFLHRKRMVKFLVENGADEMCADMFGTTPLEEAARSGDEEILGILLELTTGVKDMTRLLHMAMIGSNDVAFKFLIKVTGENVKKRGAGGWTLLHSVAIDGTTDMARFLVESGANINSRNSKGESPLHLISGGDKWTRWRKLECSVYIERKDSGENAMVDVLVELGADLGARNSNSETPLFLAATREKIEIVKLLVQFGADINAMDFWGDTPWSRAVRDGKTEMARLLVDLGADADAKLLERRIRWAWMYRAWIYRVWIYRFLCLVICVGFVVDYYLTSILTN